MKSDNLRERKIRELQRKQINLKGIFREDLHEASSPTMTAARTRIMAQSVGVADAKEQGLRVERIMEMKSDCLGLKKPLEKKLNKRRLYY